MVNHLDKELPGLIEILVELVADSCLAAVEGSWAVLLEGVEEALKRAHEQVLVDLAQLPQDVDRELEADVEANLGAGLAHTHRRKRVAGWYSAWAVLGSVLRLVLDRDLEVSRDVIEEVFFLLVIKLLALQVDAVEDIDMLGHDLAVVPTRLLLSLLRDQEVLVVLERARASLLL